MQNLVGSSPAPEVKAWLFTGWFLVHLPPLCNSFLAASSSPWKGEPPPAPRGDCQQGRSPGMEECPAEAVFHFAQRMCTRACVCLYVCMCVHVCMCAHMYSYVLVHLCTHVFVCACAWVCMGAHARVRVHVCVCTRTPVHAGVRMGPGGSRCCGRPLLSLGLEPVVHSGQPPTARICFSARGLLPLLQAAALSA